MAHSKVMLSRRSMLKLSGAAVAALAAPSIIRPVHAAEKLTVFSWETYHLDPWVKEWTARTGIPVDVVLTGSADEMYARMASGSIAPDIIIVDSGNLKHHVDSKFLAPLDLEKIPNAALVSPGLNFEKRNTINGKVYGIPYNWGVQPIMFAKKNGEASPDSWSAMWDKRYEGKVSLFDDGYATIPMIAMKIGAKDPYNLTEDEFSAVSQALRELRPQVGSIARGPSDQAATFASGDALIGYCMVVNSVFTLNANGKNRFGYAFPKEGTLGWIDNAAVTPKGARAASYQFINDMLSLPWQARFIASAQTNGVLTSSEAHKAGLADDILSKTTILDQDTPGFWEKMSVFSPPEDIERRVQIWNDFKAGTL
ncbi:ABC transporter substrate-binding protein [Pantoea vagans]|uniref:ABC transporter substrate-binding protein n=1 Tax=Pantoea vagans TaxID=470934 RepID=UPI0030170A20